MIKVLDKSVADKIAAGEVVERPLSIVKEVVENSIDSGADSIAVEIKNGGKSYIRVTDNGCGITEADVEKAFLRHATSKIENASDLDSIMTLGFRGEALASIAAVSRVELVTKVSSSKTGTKLLIHGGEIISNMPTGCPDGTTIIITDLFYNTPARRKFLKSDAAESGRIIDFMSQISLAFPDIKFRFINNGNIVFSTNGKGNRQNSIIAVYKQREYENLVPVDYSVDSIKVTGYISGPSFSRTNRRSQVFFVNGRCVYSKVIEKGVDDGYKERLFEGRFPVVFLFLEADPHFIDVNIHPNKREVRFDDENLIIETVSASIRSALSTKTAVTQVNIPKVTRHDEIITETPYISEPGESPGIPYVSEKTEGFKNKGTSVASGQQVDIKELLSTKRERDEIIEKDAEKIEIESPVIKPFNFDSLKLTGTVFGTYITAVDDDNFYLIDQHAAHERIFYEKLVSDYINGEKPSQPILTPVIIEVPLDIKENEYDWMDSLNNMGFIIDAFGQNSYIIREIPTFMSISEAEDFVDAYIDEIYEGINLMNTVVINKLITKSCKSAVKAHDYLSMEEISSLIQELKKCKNPFSCPHGRPTFIRMSKYEIEKMFKRV